MIKDKNSVIQIFGSLMKQPLLLSDNKYSITPDDFSNSLEKYIFGAIYNLYSNGVERINIVDIDNYLKGIEGVYGNFTKNKGIDFLQDCEEISDPGNFDYYYHKLKKYNLLNDLQRQGFNIDELYPTDILANDTSTKMDRLEKMSTQDILRYFKDKIGILEGDYHCGEDTKTINACDGIEELLSQIQATPDIGAPLQGDIYNTVVRGARLGKYYLRSADSGVGKSRMMIGDACGLAYPYRYNNHEDRWELVGANQKVLYVGTEQEPEEIQTMILAYLTGINEEKILYGLYSKEEEVIVKQGIDIMKKFSGNLIIGQLPDPNVREVKAYVRKQVIQKDINYVFYDYIFSSPALLGEFKESHIREDVILMIMSTALKDLAVELNVFMQSSTQVTINENERQGMKTKASIRGAKSIADKADLGVIMSRVTDKDLKMLPEVEGILPNQVTDVYKLRRGRYNNVRIWSYFDAGTCRKKDLFITTSNMTPIENFDVIHYNLDMEDIGNLDKTYQELNKGKIEANETKERKWADLI